MKKLLCILGLTLLVGINAAALSDGENDRRYNAAVLKYNAQVYDEARDELERLMRDEATAGYLRHPLIHFLLGKIYRKAEFEDLPRAKAHFERYTEQSGNKQRVAIAKTHIAYICLKLDELDEAVGIAQEILRDYPKDLDVTACYYFVYNRSAYKTLKVGGYEAALNVFKQLIKVRPTYREAYANAAFCYARLIEAARKAGNIDEEAELCAEAKELLAGAKDDMRIKAQEYLEKLCGI